MISRDIAVQYQNHLFQSFSELTSSVILINDHADKDIFHRLIRADASALGRLGYDGLRPIYKLFPDLDPLRDCRYEDDKEAKQHARSQWEDRTYPESGMSRLIAIQIHRHSKRVIKRLNMALQTIKEIEGTPLHAKLCGVINLVIKELHTDLFSELYRRFPDLEAL